MRLLLVGAGAATSTVDVENGLRDALRATPGVEVFEYDLANRLVLGKRWLEELWKARGKPADGQPTWADTLYRGSIEALEMALRFDVDWVIVISAMFLHPDALELMRRARLKVGVVLTESPYEDAKQAVIAELVDVCWTNEQASLDYLRRFNPRTYYLRAAYDPERHSPCPAEDLDVAAHDVVFVGTGFEERITLLADVDWSGIDLGLYGYWGLMGTRHRLRKYVRDGLTENARAAALYRRATIGLNLYRTSQTYGRHVPHIDVGESCNPRTYELAACGVFQLAERRPEQVATFGWSVPTFVSSADLALLVRRFLGDPAAREQCARVAQVRVAPHTFAARAAQLLADLERPATRAFGTPVLTGLQKGA